MEKYKGIVDQIIKAINDGGTEVVVRLCRNKKICEVLVVCDEQVYFAYTVGEENADFFIALLNLVSIYGTNEISLVDIIKE